MFFLAMREGKNEKAPPPAHFPCSVVGQKTVTCSKMNRGRTIGQRDIFFNKIRRQSTKNHPGKPQENGPSVGPFFHNSLHIR